MAGCAHPVGMEFCARVDYVGIGWYIGPSILAVRHRMLRLYFQRLISASVGTVVHYGFQCYPHIGQIFLACCLMTGIAGNVFPFMDWFNQYEYRASNDPVNVILAETLSFTSQQMWRILFFVSLAFTAVAPLAALAYLHGFDQMFTFVSE